MTPSTATTTHRRRRHRRPHHHRQQLQRGTEAADLSIAGGHITIHAADDCLNAANSDLTGYAFTLSISGGTLVMGTTSGDGIDSNGTLSISGGTVVVWTNSTADNQPLDADGTLSVTGGTVLAAGGSAGMGITLSGDSSPTSCSAPPAWAAWAAAAQQHRRSARRPSDGTTPRKSPAAPTTAPRLPAAQRLRQQQ